MDVKNALTSELLANGQVIRQPVGFEKGYWVGCPGTFYDAQENATYLTYRIRRPRGVAPDRGGEVRVARSTALPHFDDLWTLHKDQVNTASIERSAIHRGADGQFRYFTSFVDPADGRWFVSMLKGARVEEFDAARLQRLFSAGPLGLEGVKDPWIFAEGGTYYMFLSVATAIPQTGQEAHETLDIFNTGQCKSATGLATSTDLDHWDWQGVIFSPGESGWDQYCRRINSLVRIEDKYLAFYDGSASHLENYEERTGVAVSTDLRDWKTLSPDAPLLTSPHTSGSLRYIDARLRDGKAEIYYELARPDGAHDLRLVNVAPAALSALARG
jgi:hypothetical protein